MKRYFFIIVVIVVTVLVCLFLASKVHADGIPVFVDVCVERTDKGEFLAGFFFISREAAWNHLVQFEYSGSRNPTPFMFEDLERQKGHLFLIPEGFDASWGKMQTPVREDSGTVSVKLTNPETGEYDEYQFYVPSIAEVQEDWETPWEFTYSPCPNPWP